MTRTEREKYNKWIDAEGWRYKSPDSERGMFTFIGVGGGIAAALVFSMFVLVFGDMITPGWERINEPGNKDIMAPWYEIGLAVIGILGGLVTLIGESVTVRTESLRKRTNGLSSDQRQAVDTYRELPSVEQKRLRSSLIDFLEMDHDQFKPLYVSHDTAWKKLKQDVAERDQLLLESRAVTAADVVKQISESIKHETQLIKKDIQA